MRKVTLEINGNKVEKEVQDNTGFELVVDSENITETPLPSDKQLLIIREFLDPENLREKALPDRS